MASIVRILQAQHTSLRWAATNATSAVGTFETCRMTLRMSANRGRPEVSGAQRDAYDPSRKWTVGAFGNTITIESERPVALGGLWHLATSILITHTTKTAETARRRNKFETSDEVNPKTKSSKVTTSA
jgi:hypothetical protein